ncbi:MAG: lysozyme, partial [Aeromonas sp.]
MAKQLSQGHGLSPQQLDAFVRLGQAQREGKTLGQAASDFTTAWRSADPIIFAPPPAPVIVTPEQRQTIWRSAVRLTNLEQPDESTCQSATIAMLLGEDAAEIPEIRQALLKLGSAGSPQVMAQYLRSKLGSRYELSLTANLHECVLWLKSGEALGTHGWHTTSGHVFLLDEVDLDPDLAAPRFSAKDPYGEFDFKTWKFKPGTRFYDGWMSALGIYSLCVVIGGAGVSKGAYRDGDVSLEQRGMWVHRVKPTVSPVPAQVLQAQARGRINAAGRKIITDSEGLSLTAYLCPSQVWTIGRGSTIWFDNRPVRSGQTCTQVQADQLFDRDLARFEQDVAELVKAP